MNTNFVFSTVIIFITAFFYSVLTANAQNFNGGILAGMNTSQIDGDGYSGFYKVGFIFGGYVNRDLRKDMTGEFEIIYIGKGSKITENPDPNECYYCKISLHYIEMPFLLQFKGLKIREKELKFIFETGLSFGVLFSYKEWDNDGELKKNEHIISGGYNPTELGFIAGLNYPVSERISANARFAYSILPIANKYEVKTWGYWGLFGGSFNRLFSLTLRYQFKVRTDE